MSLAYCVNEKKPCVLWVEKYFKDCLCNYKDNLSFAFGICSLLCWAVAEIPQIVTNFQTKSSHGVSLVFLLTWVAGDVFNLVGCLLEPATLPTQFYTALLYTVSTIVLVLQSIYYDYLWKFWHSKDINHNQPVEEDKLHLNPKKDGDFSLPIPSLPSMVPPRREFYYTSARSLAGSDTPPFRSYMRVAKSGPSTLLLDNDSSSDDETTYVSSNNSTKPRPIPRSVGVGTLVATSINFLPQSKAFKDIHMGYARRRFLQEHGEHSAYGQWLGWLMAAIYMGGRIPQIYLNIRRGNVEGLNPLMFIFAMVANITYVGSILIRTTEWASIHANLPWLLDAIVCVVLDLFIILQYIYYKYFHEKMKMTRAGKKYGDYTVLS